MLYEPFANWLAGRGLSHRSVTEYVKYIRRADRWLREHEGTELAIAAPHHVRAWADTLTNSWSTRKQARTALSHWQRWAEHPEDLAAAIRVPRKPKMRPRALPDEQTARLEQAAHQHGREGLAVLLGLYLGMRRTEIASARWTGYEGTHWTWQRAKTGDMAYLPVHPRLAAALDRVERTGPFLFPGDRGAPHVAPVTIWQWVRDVGAACGVDVSTHQLRHSCISAIVAACGLRVGQEWAGHRDPEVTAGYSLVREVQMVEASRSLPWGMDDGGDDDPPAAAMPVAA